MDGAPVPICERLDAIREALHRGRDALFELSTLEVEGSDLLRQIVAELAGSAADATYQAEGLYGTLKGMLGCG